MADHGGGEAVEGFMAITGASDGAARRMLEMCGYDFENAVQLWFADEDLQRSLENPAPATSTAARAGGGGPSTSAPRGSARPGASLPRQTGREDAQGVIHIDSDDDDAQMTEDESYANFDDDDDSAVAATVARTAQEEEDAAMAKRLQEELFSGGTADDVRAPLARTTETLVAPSEFGPSETDNVLDMLRRNRQVHPRPRNNPFSQPSIWDDAGSRGAGPSGSATPTRAQRLAELFRPPYDLTSPLTFDEARDEGKSAKKWILVNLQDMSDFNCQALNRDIWKDEAVKELVSENFIFLQFDKLESAADQYLTFYFPNQSHENPNNFPHVSIIDPRTGEQVKVWSGAPFPSAADFHSQLVEFLDRYSLAANRKNPVTKAKRPERVVNVDRMTEEEMLQLAMQNSLEANGSAGQPNLIDPDELTRSINDLSSVKGKELAESPTAEAPEPAAPASTFTRIPSDRPHVEPQADPKTTTRIQVRHPAGRVIRRFRLDEPVSRMYEWLKAEPLAGKEGVEFELKSMPQGTDLINLLDHTISEAGLANGTVMIEFIEGE